jgi:hypothetical protein
MNFLNFEFYLGARIKFKIKLTKNEVNFNIKNLKPELNIQNRSKLFSLLIDEREKCSFFEF